MSSHDEHHGKRPRDHQSPRNVRSHHRDGQVTDMSPQQRHQNPINIQRPSGGQSPRATQNTHGRQQNFHQRQPQKKSVSHLIGNFEYDSYFC